MVEWRAKQMMVGTRVRSVLLAFLLALFPCTPLLSDDVNISKEYQVKAAYLYNILKFVDWSDEMPAAALQLCVYGSNPFGGLLQALEQRSVNGHAIKTHVISGSSIDNCHVVFFSDKNQSQNLKLINLANAKKILTIGEQNNFNVMGGIIQFIEVNNTIRFDLNMTKAKAVGLKINSQLAETAREVQ